MRVRVTGHMNRTNKEILTFSLVQDKYGRPRLIIQKAYARRTYNIPVVTHKFEQARDLKQMLARAVQLAKELWPEDNGSPERANP